MYESSPSLAEDNFRVRYLCIFILCWNPIDLLQEKCSRLTRVKLLAEVWPSEILNDTAFLVLIISQTFAWTSRSQLKHVYRSRGSRRHHFSLFFRSRMSRGFSHSRHTCNDVRRITLLQYFILARITVISKWKGLCTY